MDTSSVEDGTVVGAPVVGAIMVRIFSTSKPTNLLFGRLVAIVVVGGSGSTFSIFAFRECMIDSTAELVMESSILITTSMGAFVVVLSVTTDSSEEDLSALSVVE